MNVSKSARAIAAILTIFGSLVGASHGAIVLSDVGGFAQVAFTAPITFQATDTVSGPPAFFNLIAEDYFTSDTPPVTGNATSGGITTSNSANTIAVISTNSAELNLYDRNDLLISFSAGSAINVGGFITFQASSFVSDISFASLPGVNDSASVTMTNNFNQAISGSQIIAIPEPSSSIFVGIGALACLGVRRRQAKVEQGRAGNV